MVRKAIVREKDGLVINIIEYDPSSYYPIPEGFILADVPEYNTPDNFCDIGSTFDGAKFREPKRRYRYRFIDKNTKTEKEITFSERIIDFPKLGDNVREIVELDPSVAEEVSKGFIDFLNRQAEKLKARNK